MRYTTLANLRNVILGDISAIDTLTQAQYDAIGSPGATTLATSWSG